MEEIISREAIMNGAYPEVEWVQELLRLEPHHNHPIICNEHGTWRWQKNKNIDDLITKIGLNELSLLLQLLGYGRESEVYRHMYRCMGYSLSGYYGIFHSGDE